MKRQRYFLLSQDYFFLISVGELLTTLCFKVIGPVCGTVENMVGHDFVEFIEDPNRKNSTFCRIVILISSPGEKQTFTFLHTNVIQRRKATNGLTSAV